MGSWGWGRRVVVGMWVAGSNCPPRKKCLFAQREIKLGGPQILEGFGSLGVHHPTHLNLSSRVVSVSVQMNLGHEMFTFDRPFLKKDQNSCDVKFDTKKEGPLDALKFELWVLGHVCVGMRTGGKA